MLDASRYDFFVSYARRDNAEGWIARFVEGILAEHKTFSGGRELTCFFDQSEIRTGDDWQHRIHHGVAESRVFLAFVSPRYLASEWCRKEWRAWIDAEIAAHVFSEGAAPVYIVEVPGFEDARIPPERVAGEIARLCEVSDAASTFQAEAGPVIHQLRRRQFVSLRPFYQEGIAALERADLRRVLAQLAKEIEARSQRVRTATESANTVPPYNRNFSGRVEELLTLRERLKNARTGVVCGVHGLGGIGKTELALAYAHAFAGVYPGGRLLVPCEGRASLREAALALADFADFQAAIGDEARKTPASLFAGIVGCLQKRLAAKGSILLLLDNVTNPALMAAQETDELTKLGPKLHLLMTTRLGPPAGANWLTLGELPEADAMELLEKHRAFADEAEREAGRRMVKRLGGFALSVELVAAWLAAHPGSGYQSMAEGLGLADLEEIAADQDVVLRRHNDERRLSAVLGPVLAGLTNVEGRTLEMAALLPPDAVALPWLKALVEAEMPQAFAPEGRIADPWAEVCGRLMRLALFTRTGADDRLVRMHRLVQDLVKSRRAPERSGQLERVVENLIETRAAALQGTSRWETARWELDPLEAAAKLWAEGRRPDAPGLLSQAGLRRLDVAEWARAEPLLRQALALTEARSGPNHPQVAIHLNNLAQLLQDTNRLAEAEQLLRRALAIDEATYGPHHPKVALRLSNLATLFQETNRLHEAEPLMRDALAIAEAVHGPDDPRTAVYLNNLAQLLRTANQLKEAEALMRRGLAIDEAILTADHPKIAVHLNNLAQLLQDTARTKEAEPFMRRALAIDEAAYGPNHPNVAMDLGNLAMLLMETNRGKEAEPMVRRAIEIDEASYGPNHPQVAINLNNLAQLLQERHRLPDAEAVMRRAVGIFLDFTRGTKHEHPYLRAAVMSYASLLQAMNLPPQKFLARLSSLGPEPAAILVEEVGRSRA